MKAPTVAFHVLRLSDIPLDWVAQADYPGQPRQWSRVLAGIREHGVPIEERRALNGDRCPVEVRVTLDAVAWAHEVLDAEPVRSGVGVSNAEAALRIEAARRLRARGVEITVRSIDEEVRRCAGEP